MAVGFAGPLIATPMRCGGWSTRCSRRARSPDRGRDRVGSRRLAPLDRDRNVKVTFVYAQPRRALLEKIARGEAPDSQLLGQSHLGEFGIDADVHDPRVSRRRWRSGAANWLAWYGRELLLPWELSAADAVCTPLSTLFPIADRLRSQKVFILNQGLCNTLSRASPLRRLLQVASLRATAAVICHSTADRECLLAETGLAPDRVHTAALGVDQSFFVPSNGPGGDYVLAVGFDVARDYATFVTAMRGLSYRTVIVARPRNLEGIQVPPDVEVLPDPSFVELRELYAGARCVVIPIRHEDYPFGGDTSGITSLLEAMAMAKPVIVSERRTLSDYVVNGQSARIVPAENPVALREVIQETFEDRSQREALGDAALQTVRERHTTRHLSERIAAIIRSTVPSSSAAIPEPAGHGPPPSR
jgi:glycosyltransferase involved in cell wall biosynthesis